MIEHQYGFNIVETRIRIDAGLEFSLGPAMSTWSPGVTGFIACYPDANPPRPIAAQDFQALGIVEHIAHHDAGDGKGGVMHSTDFRDSYVVKAPNSETLMRRIAAVEDAHRSLQPG
ncbi:hypothetical protein [Streptomyces ureilyticus]|uniref:Uncharacterized protein n=1 Tax=Streptomyces ureilyticus TaxID=1775131 RepID=A0ABX0DYY8_9ACTN|nr:hypothetical protein [Streptomyces ureilyticus]NGO45860.1 hypothetical protein [Streptomyces ureilyticus]